MPEVGKECLIRATRGTNGGNVVHPQNLPKHGFFGFADTRVTIELPDPQTERYEQPQRHRQPRRCRGRRAGGCSTAVVRRPEETMPSSTNGSRMNVSMTVGRPAATLTKWSMRWSAPDRWAPGSTA